jgi:signal transduction histidine kinase/HAMP domain-containing protein
VRLGIKGKQIAAVTAIVGVAIVALSALHVARLAGIVLHESQARGQLLANAILHRTRELVTATKDPYGALREDPGLRAILESSIYGESVTDASILDTRGTIIASSDPTVIGKPLRARADLTDLVNNARAIDQLQVIYAPEGQSLEVRLPMFVGDEAFGSIRVGVSTLLMRQEVNASLRPALFTAAIALAVAVLVAAFLARLLLRPIHVLRSGLTRLGKGDFGVRLDLPPGDEFGELGDFFNTVSQQLSADRTLLAGQKANLQQAVEHLEDAVALFNPHGELLFSNPAMQPTLAADAIGRALHGLLPDGHPYRTIVEETLATRKSRGPVQVRLEGADDDHLLMTHAVEGTDGELVGVLLVARNLAYLSKMQSTIAYSRKLVALGRLTSGIAHEIKNPLNAMRIHLELLRTKIARAMPVPAPQPVALGGRGGAGEGGRGGLSIAEAPQGGTKGGPMQHVEIIETEIRRLDEVLQGFLKFTRPEDLRLQPVAVRAIFDEILPLIDPEAKKNNVRVAVDLPGSLPRINGDAAMLRQALLNLAINACQAMPQGGTLRLSAAPAARGRVEVRVEDTGVGIPPQNLGRIFDLYFTTKEHGTGIGLSMVFRIVQMHDGEVEVQSTPGHGTTFRVLLPRANES